MTNTERITKILRDAGVDDEKIIIAGPELTKLLNEVIDMAVDETLKITKE